MGKGWKIPQPRVYIEKANNHLINKAAVPTITIRTFVLVSGCRTYVLIARVPAIRTKVLVIKNS